MITIINYGMGNLGSIANMLKKVGAEACVSADPAAIAKAEKLVLPGVGAFDNGMANLAERGLIPALNEAVGVRRVPILGLCLGMQLFGRRSEEGRAEGLGWIDGECRRFRFGGEQARMKVPHMGWNRVRIVARPSPLQGMGADARFYFVHSYHMVCADPALMLTTTDYGITFVSGVMRDNIVGVQFHPEKSHRFGMELFRNFAKS
jgi:glutamine amidotransferase